VFPPEQVPYFSLEDLAALGNSSIFEESRHRVRRAKLHRNAFADQWNALIKRDAFSFFVECNADRTGFIRFRRQSPYSHDVSLELGEFFYQLRAALDCLAFTAVRQVAGDPVPNEDGIYFPIADTPEGYQRLARNLSRLPQELREWIKSIQPCFARDSADDFLRQTSDLLELLHDCARKDRHRRLTILSPWGSELAGSFSFTPAVQIEHLEGGSCNLFDAEGTIAKFRVAEYIPALQVQLECNLYVDVVMENIAFKGPLFEKALDNIGRAVDHVIIQFETAFSS
jgi:hypothetical protein